MGNVLVTQEAIEVLADDDAGVRVTQQAVQVLSDTSAALNVRVTQQAVQVLSNSSLASDVRVTQQALSLLADPPGTVTVTQGLLNILAEDDSSILLSQTAIQVLADAPGGLDPGDVFVTPPGSPVGLTSTLSTIQSLDIRPLTKTKWLILAQCSSGVTYAGGIDACQTVLGPSVFLIDGTTVAQCNIGNLQTYYCLDAELGQTYTLTIKAAKLHTDGDDAAYCARIAAIGIDNWYRIEQGVEATLNGPVHKLDTTLMEDIIEPKFGNSLVFNYAEYEPDDIPNLRGTYTVEFDSPRLKNYKPIDMVLQQKSGFKEDFTDITYDPSSRWSCISSVNLVDFRGSRTSVKYTSTKLDQQQARMFFRRLRTVIIPVFDNPIGNIHSLFSKGGEDKTGVATEALTLTPPPRTCENFSYLILANVKTHVSSGDGPVQTVFRYNGLGLSGVTTNLVGLSGLLHVAGITSTYLAGITFGLQNDDIMGVKTYNYLSGAPIYPGYNGEQYFGFAYVAATQTLKDSYYYFSSTQFQSEIEVVSKTGDRLLAVVQLT